MAEGLSNYDEDDDDDDEIVESQPEVVEVEKPKPADKTDSKTEEKTPADKENDRHQQIEELVGGLQTGEWQKAQESERLDKRYGKGLLGNFRAWLGGEFDYSVDPETGEIRHNVGNEIGRRVVNVLWKTAKTAAIISAVGLLTGGAGAVPAGAILGSSLGRGFCEAWKGFSGKEGSLREKLILARESYYDEAERLSKEIGPENPDGITGTELEKYHKDRDEKISDLVRLVYSAEKEAVDKDKAEKEGKEKEEKEKKPAANLANVIEAEGELSGYQKKWRTAEEIIAFVGGITGGVYSLLHAKGQVVQHLQSQLDHGESLRMDIDHDGVFHSVSKIDSGIKAAHDMSSNYVFHYNSPFEAKLAELQGSTVLHQGQFGAHVISDNISSGLSRIATGQLWHQSISTLLGMAADSAVSSKINESENKLGDDYQKSFPESSGKTLEFLLPESKLDRIKAKAKELGKTVPKPGEIWNYPPQGNKKKDGGGQGGDKEPKERKVKIISIDYIDEEVPTLTFESGQQGSEKREKVALETFITAKTKLLQAEKKIEEDIEPTADEVQPKRELTPEEVAKNKIREAAGYTIGKLGDFNEVNKRLHADTLEEGEKKFEEVTKEIWTEFAVHGYVKVNKKGAPYVEAETDIDGKTALGLFEQAGFSVGIPKFVKPGDIENGRVNLDTGEMDGSTYIPSAEVNQRTLVIDHHAADSSITSSAAAETYEILVGLGYLEKSETFDKMIDFISQVDNCRYATSVEDYQNSHKNLYGLSRYLTFESLYKFFQDGKDPAADLSEEDLRNYGISAENVTAKVKNIEWSEKKIAEAEADGFVLQSDKYGKILIDIDKKIPGSFDAVRSHGYDTYVIWTPGEASFFISSNKGIQDNFTGGKIIRRNMSIKPRHDGQPLETTLNKILKSMVGGEIGASGKLAEYLRNESSA